MGVPGTQPVLWPWPSPGLSPVALSCQCAWLAFLRPAAPRLFAGPLGEPIRLEGLLLQTCLFCVLSRRNFRH